MTEQEALDNYIESVEKLKASYERSIKQYEAKEALWAELDSKYQQVIELHIADVEKWKDVANGLYAAISLPRGKEWSREDYKLRNEMIDKYENAIKNLPQ